MTARYEQRRPESTLLYQLVAEHLESFLTVARESTGRGLPRYVERELRAYLACGIHAHGFLRARCAECGKELLVAFSCKRRGVCPSCNARRMCATAAHLTDCVLPDVPLRQWVLSVPFELRLLLAKRADALSAVGRIFVQEILRWQRAQARISDPSLASLPATELHSGAICFPQRFGGSLNLNVHYHVAVPDGVFARDAEGSLRFHQLPLPNPGDLHDIGHAVELRVLRWLKRRGLLQAATEPAADPSDPPTALDACLQGSLGIGEFVALPDHDPANEAAAAEPVAPLGTARRGKSRRGFDIHASVGVGAADHEGRERLLRYCARAPLSLERLSLLENGRVAYRIKAPQGRRTHRIMTPLQFLARLCALIPPPRHPLVRFHGVFAPHSSFRSAVVALVRSLKSPCDPAAGAPTQPRLAPAAAIAPPSAAAPTAPMSDEPRPRFASRIDWATLLQRVYDFDALACSCGGRLRVIALITEPQVAAAILTALHLPSTPPPIARARAPDDFNDLAS